MTCHFDPRCRIGVQASSRMPVIDGSDWSRGIASKLGQMPHEQHRRQCLFLAYPVFTHTPKM